MSKRIGCFACGKVNEDEDSGDNRAQTLSYAHRRQVALADIEVYSDMAKFTTLLSTVK